MNLLLNPAIVDMVEQKLSQKELFLEIWRERPHVSQISDVRLGPEPLAYYFSHVLPKGAYPSGKFDKDNILLMTFDEHRTWENYKHKIADAPEWQWVFKLAADLREKYNKTAEKNLGYMQKYYL